MFPSVSPKQSFPDLESEVLDFWKANSIFQKSIDSRPEDNPYRFYDGPPFITGTPHYGSLLSSVVKDVVGRYWTMRGKRVERVWGWDCHGLPIEEKVQKKLGLSSNKEIEERGVKEFIDGCYEYTESTSAEWNWYIDKIGRWVDMDRAYRTMDQDYMESVMWVFHQLWNKGLIYEGKRVSLYSWKLGTPISNFEVAMDDTYQEVHDPAITVKFKPLSQNSTGLIIKNQSGKVLFLKKKKNSKWTLVGGKCEQGESHLDCVKRETLEEIGLKIEDMRVFSWMGSVVHGKYWNECMFETDVTLEAVPVLEDTFSEYAFFSAEDFPELEAVEPYDRFMLEYLKGNMTQYPEPWNVNILAWTTTPWTIPANMALAVGKDIDYVLVEYSSLGKGILQKYLSPGTPLSGGDGERSETEGVDSIHHDNPPNPPLRGLTEGNPLGGITEEMPFSGAEENPQSGILGTTHSGKESHEQFIVAKNRAETVFKGKGAYTIIREFKGSELVGLSYVPPFPEYYWENFSVGNPLSGGDGENGTGVHRMERTPFSGGLQKDLSPGTPLSGGDGERSETEGVRETHDNPPNPPLRGLAEENPLRGLTEEVLFSEGNPQSSHTRVSLQKNFHIYHADFATDSDGTGIVHIAPEFGESDFALAKKEGIAISEALDDAGKYTAQIFDHEGLHYQEANTVNIERMKENGTLFKHESITHRVPFCPRSNTPLVQKAQKSWFIDIESQKEKLLKANEQIHWFPEYLKFGRFAKGIESAPDWCISRTRYWGAPMPVWMNEKGEKLVVGSREEIFERNKPYGQLTKVIFVRHGRTDYNEAKKQDSINKAQLTEKGKQQAEDIRNMLAHKQIDAIYASPFDRCQDTIRPLAQAHGLSIQSIHEFQELQKPSWQDQVFDCSSLKWDETPEGDESLPEAYDRIYPKLQELIRLNAGKTIVICTHGDPFVLMELGIHDGVYQDFKKKMPSNKGDVKDFVREYYVFSDSGKVFNLHKPYIDSILLTNEATRPKKVLGIHGFRRNESVADFFVGTRKNLEKKGIEISCPHFETGNTVNYEKWKKIFSENIEGVDTIFCHSLGCRFALDMVIKNKISLRRLILIAPPEGKHEAQQDFYKSLKEDVGEIKNYVDEVIVLYSLDDKEPRVHASRELVEKTRGYGISVNGYGHFNLHECKLIEGLIECGTPFTRIPEVLDVWMDSGSMPYAQMHYPFENREEMESSFPADFIAEYVGQIRAWFYVMHVLGVLLDIRNDSSVKELSRTNDETEDLGRAPQVPTPAFLNVITTGVINGNDGRKMSKSYGNYPDPRETIEKYGADPIRFYMLNSPLLSGGDMDFKEEGIIETIKSVMLPLWNTYSFFTTYANIDSWKPSETEVFYMRHGETIMNAEKKMSGGEDNSPLTEKGREQARIAGKEAKEQGISFDIIVSSPLMRARETAEIMAQEVLYTGEIITYESLKEQMAGKFADMTHDEIMSQYHLESVSAMRRLYKEENGIENVDMFEKRILETFEEIRSHYSGKKILIVAHSGVFRPLHKVLLGLSKEEAYFSSGIPNASITHLPSTPLVNPLDRWMLSRLQILIGEVHDAMEGYDVSRACRAIVEFMDELTNWYVRLSRRRFWGSKMTPDKNSAYSTLYTVLVESSKLLAPFMPFLAEGIYKGLTDSSSKEYPSRSEEYMAQESQRTPQTSLSGGLQKEDIFSLDGVSPRITPLSGGDGERSETEGVDEIERTPQTPFSWGLQKETISENLQIENLGGDLQKGSSLGTPLSGGDGERSETEGVDEIERTPQTPFSWGLQKEDIFSLDGVSPRITPLSGGDVKRSETEGVRDAIQEPVDNSVHLQYATLPERYLIAEDLNRDMEICEHIVSLGLALRSRKGVRVRQPLSSITITRSLDQYYQNTIREELNVKVIRFENPEKIARKICKPDARKIGPKYGKDVQYIIQESKAGNFVEGKNGKIIIGYSKGTPLSGGDGERSETEGVDAIEITPQTPLSGGFRRKILSGVSQKETISENLQIENLGGASQKYLSQGTPLSGGDGERSETEGVRETHDNPPNPPLRGLPEENPLRGLPEENPLRGLHEENSKGLTEENTLKVLIDKNTSNGITEEKSYQKEFILEPGEYTLEYMPLDGVGDVEGGYGMVIAMDMEISEDLRLEGYARDIIRTIQEMRKNANYHVTDRIAFSLTGPGVDTLERHFGVMIQNETLGQSMADISPDATQTLSLDNDEEKMITIMIRKM